jgi:hypothetical protein
MYPVIASNRLVKSITSVVRSPENAVLLRRILVRVLIVVSLYPILLGGVANMQLKFRARWLEMRREHREALDRSRARRLDRQQSAGSVEPIVLPDSIPVSRRSGTR